MMKENELFQEEGGGDRYLTPIFGSEAKDAVMPSLELADKPVEPRIAYEMIREYLSIEGNATQNAATFCQTYMEPTAAKLMAENLQKNAIDKDEYPMTADLENRCVAMIGNLWHADPREEPMGTSTVGSSEACMLGGLAMLFRWKKLARAAGIDVYSEQRPNLVISSGYQVCWEKFCRYWDVEMRTVPLDEEHLSLNMDALMDYVDDHTIGITAILGITYTGKYDDVAALDALVGRYNESHPAMPVRIHVDAASGGMVAPFVEPRLKWDFRCENVWSISTSGHKYGLVYPGVGLMSGAQLIFCYLRRPRWPSTSRVPPPRSSASTMSSCATGSKGSARSIRARSTWPASWRARSSPWGRSTSSRMRARSPSCAGA